MGQTRGPPGGRAEAGDEVTRLYAAPPFDTDPPLFPITDDWLRVVGFRKVWMNDSQQPHWLLWCGDQRQSFTGSDDLGIELGPPHAPAHKNDDPRWWCWLRSDCSHSRGRFLFMRYVKSQQDVIALVEAITGVPWDPSRHQYGSVRYPGQKLEEVTA